MTWLFPAGAVAGIALIAIVVLHMRHRMPEVIAFPQLSFWPRVPSESRESPRWRKPPISLLFFLQLLAALLLVLAFMRPAIPGLGAFGGQRTSAVHHVVVLDGSTSMLAETAEGGTRWEAGKEQVHDLLGDWQQGDGVTLVVASSRPVWKSAVDGHQLDELRTWLDQLVLPGGVPDDQPISSLLSDIALPDLEQRVMLVTDGGLDVTRDGAEVDRVLVGDTTGGNVAIVETSVSAAENGGRVVEAMVLHDRSGTETLPWVVRSADQELASGTMTLASGETGAFSANIPDGVESVALEIVADDVLPADNRSTISFRGDVLTGLHVVLVSDVPGATRRALDVLPGAVVETYPSTTPGIRSVAANADLVVYEAAAPSEDDVPTVPMLLIQPTGVSDAWQISGVAPDPQLSDVALDEPIMREVSLEGVVFGETPIYVLDPSSTVLVTGNESDTDVPLVWRGALEDQPYVAYAFDPSQSNISHRVTFPVLVAQTVAALSGEGGASTYAPGDLVALDLAGDAATVRATDPEGQSLTVPVVQGADGSTTATVPISARPGLWSLVVEGADGSEIGRGSIVVNAGDTAESRLSGADPVAVSVSGSTSDSAAGEPGSGEALSDMWPLLVIAGIVVIALEWWLWLFRSIGRRHITGGQPS